MAKVVRWRSYPWKGSRYIRSDGSWRQRQSGFVEKNKNGKRAWVGVEKPKMNVYGYDPHKNQTSFRKWSTRVRANRATAKKRRSSHTRRLR